jgi:hypothetical protein
MAMSFGVQDDTFATSAVTHLQLARHEIRPTISCESSDLQQIDTFKSEKCSFLGGWVQNSPLDSWL